MTFTFERLEERHAEAVTAIFNHYIEHSTAAWREEPVGPDFIAHFLPGEGDILCSFAILAEGRVAGFCTLEAFIPIPTFARVAEVMLFLHPDFTGKGAGTQALQMLEGEAKSRGIAKLLAEASDENEGSLRFQQAHGFTEYGHLPGAGYKPVHTPEGVHMRSFGIRYLMKELK